MAAWLPVAGATLIIPDWNGHHLFAILNDPVHMQDRGGEVCLLANISTCDGGRFDDLTCVFPGGCHPHIRDKSYIVYSLARVEKSVDLIARVTQAIYKPYPHPFSATMVSQILAGFASTPHSNADRREVVEKILNP